MGISSGSTPTAAKYAMTFTFTAPTGLTLEAILRDDAGSTVGSAITTGFVEIASSGWYMWTGLIDYNTQGALEFRESGGGDTQALFSINPTELEALLNYWVRDRVSAGTSGTVFAGSASLSSDDDFYNKSVVAFVTGALRGRGGLVDSYDGSTKEFTLRNSLPATPTAGDEYIILGLIV